MEDIPPIASNVNERRRRSARMQASTNRTTAPLPDHLPLRDIRADIISSDDDFDAEFAFPAPSLSQNQSVQSGSGYSEGLPQGPIRRPPSRATHRSQPYHNAPLPSSSSSSSHRVRDFRSDGDSPPVYRPSSALSEPSASSSTTRTRDQGEGTSAMDRTSRSVIDEVFSSAAQLLSQMQSDIRSGRLFEPGVGRRGEEGRIENGRVIPTRESMTPSPQRLPQPTEGFRPFSRGSVGRAVTPVLQRQSDYELPPEWARETSASAPSASMSSNSRPAGPRFVPLGARDLSQFPRSDANFAPPSRNVARVVRFSELLGGNNSLNAVNSRDSIDLSIVSHPSHSYISAPPTAPTGTDERVEVVKTESTAVRRLRKEAEYIRKHAPPGCSAAPKEGDLYEWSAVVEGPPDTVYEGGTFFMDISFNDEYPNAAPKVTFLTRIYHCNINAAGHVCVDVLREKWKTEMNIGTVLESIVSLMYSCNPEDPLVVPIAAQFRQNKEEFERTAKIWTIRYAT